MRSKKAQGQKPQALKSYISVGSVTRIMSRTSPQTIGDDVWNQGKVKSVVEMKAGTGSNPRNIIYIYNICFLYHKFHCDQVQPEPFEGNTRELLVGHSMKKGKESLKKEYAII